MQTSNVNSVSFGALNVYIAAKSKPARETAEAIQGIVKGNYKLKVKDLDKKGYDVLISAQKHASLGDTITLGVAEKGAEGYLQKHTFANNSNLGRQIRKFFANLNITSLN